MQTAYILPDSQWLPEGQPVPAVMAASTASSNETEAVIQDIQDVLSEAGLPVAVTASIAAPQATRFELTLGPAVPLQAVGELKERFASKLSRFGAIRMLLPIPGRDRAGIEVPNRNRIFFPAECLFRDPAWTEEQGRLPLLIGHDESRLYTLDLSTGSHLLLTGYDDAGKSTLLRQILLSVLSRKTPDEVRLLLFEAKSDTFKPFAGIPHLMVPQAKSPEGGCAMLEWCVQETRRRRKLLAQAGVQKLEEYRARNAAEALPDILFLIDEIAPLFTARTKARVYELLKVLDSAGAVGLHLLVATATIPEQPFLETFAFRICGRCLQESLSQSTLGETGAEVLLGHGDFLLKTGEAPVRCQAGLVGPALCQALAAFWIAQRPAQYDGDVQEFLRASVEAQRTESMAVKEASLSPQLHFAEPTANDALRAVLAVKKAQPAVVSAALGVSGERAANLLDELTFHEYLGIPDAHGERAIRWEKLPPEFLGKAEATRKTLESLLLELDRKIQSGDTASRTVAEYNKGVHAIGKKIVEEAAEVWMAAEYEGSENTALEISQLFYHLLVLMLKKGISLEDIYKQL